MNHLYYFFRGVSDNAVYDSYSPTHIILLILTAVISLYIYFNRETLRKPSADKKLKIFFIVSLLTQQVMLYSWYVFSGYFKITESLPLYHCRVAIICTIIGLITNRSIFRSIGCMWGSVGAVIALIIPNPDPFLFPHFTLLSYFAGHMILLWANMYVLFVQEFTLQKKELLKTLVITNVFHLFVLGFDMLTDANYCYLISAPFNWAIFNDPIVKMIYTPAIFVLFSLAIIIFYALTNIRQATHQRVSLHQIKSYNKYK
ncbi:MAG: TIGR02206 family membrane protein [Peptostreptococcaceae bacterium]|nr:TIGR02206 family membrane protein [Peptostreptococcaceae bacterium]